MKSSRKSSIPPEPEKPQISSYMLFCKEQRAKDSDAVGVGELGTRFKNLSDKEKSQLEERQTQIKKDYTKDYAKWLESAKSRGYPDYPSYSKKAIKKVLKKESFNSAALPMIGLAAGAFTQVVKESLKKYMKEKKAKTLNIEILLKFIEADPDKILATLKETKLFDKYITSFKTGEAEESDSDEKDKAGDKKKGKGC